MAQDREQLMESMLGAATGAPEPQESDPKSLLDSAIERVNSYIANPAEVTPETLQELASMLQQASAALAPEA
jgi:hypothetical protein